MCTLLPECHLDAVWRCNKTDAASHYQRRLVWGCLGSGNAACFQRRSGRSIGYRLSAASVPVICGRVRETGDASATKPFTWWVGITGPALPWSVHRVAHSKQRRCSGYGENRYPESVGLVACESKVRGNVISCTYPGRARPTYRGCCISLGRLLTSDAMLVFRHTTRRHITPSGSRTSSWCKHVCSSHMRLWRTGRQFWDTWSRMPQVRRTTYEAQRRQWPHKESTFFGQYSVFIRAELAVPKRRQTPGWSDCATLG